MSNCPRDQRTGLRVSLRVVGLVHAALTRNPAAPIRQLARELRVSSSAVQGAIRALDQAGYVEAAHGKSRARRVVVPCALIAPAEAR